MSFWQGLYNVGPARDSKRSQEPRGKGVAWGPEARYSTRDANVAEGDPAPRG